MKSEETNENLSFFWMILHITFDKIYIIINFSLYLISFVQKNQPLFKMKNSRKILIILSIIFMINLITLQQQSQIIEPNHENPQGNHNNPSQIHTETAKNPTQNNDQTKKEESHNNIESPNPEAQQSPSKQSDQVISPLTQSQHNKRLDLDKVLHEAKKIGLFNQTQLHNINGKLNETLGEMTPEQAEKYLVQFAKNAQEAYLSYMKIHEDQQKKEEESLKEYRIDQIAEETAEIPKIITKTEEYKLKESTKVKDYYKNNQQDNRGSFNSYSFTLENKNIADFRIEVPVNQKIMMSNHVYVKTGGIYNFQDSAQDSQSLQFYIYQNRHKLIYHNTFYFQDLNVFNVTANASYLLRFNNPGKHRMIFMTIKYVVENHHIDQAIKSQHAYDYSKRIEMISNNFINKLQESKNQIVLQDLNQKTMLSKLETYYYFSEVEIVFIGILCFIQVECIRKMLDNQSII